MKPKSGGQPRPTRSALSDGLTKVLLLPMYSLVSLEIGLALSCACPAPLDFGLTITTPRNAPTSPASFGPVILGPTPFGSGVGVTSLACTVVVVESVVVGVSVIAKVRVVGTNAGRPKSDPSSPAGPGLNPETRSSRSGGKKPRAEVCRCWTLSHAGISNHSPIPTASARAGRSPTATSLVARPPTKPRR